MRVHLTGRNMRRVFVLALFVTALVLLRHLGLLFVFFVLFERSLGFCAAQLSKRTRLPYAASVITVLILFLAVIGVAALLAARGVITNLEQIKASGEQLVALVQGSELYQEYGGDHIVDKLKSHGSEALHYATVAGKNALYLLIALILAVIFLLEHEDLSKLRDGLPADSAQRVVLSFFGHTADAVAITFRLQLVVAIVNALFTLPVLLIIGLPGIPALIALLVVSGLVPVVGGAVAGAVLMTIAYITKGVVGLVVFVVWTFVLHKLESYVLTPRLTAQHVSLPSFVIVVSLIVFEHLFGLVGLFLSFPFLFVTARVRESWDAE